MKHLPKNIVLPMLVLFLLTAACSISVSQKKTSAPPTPSAASATPKLNVLATQTQPATAVVQNTAAPTPTAIPPQATAEVSPTMPAGALISCQNIAVYLYASVGSTADCNALAAEDNPLMGYIPEYREIALKGYPLQNTFLRPSIKVFPVSGFTKNNFFKAEFDKFQTLMAQQPTGQKTLPFLPLQNAAQVFAAQQKYLSFEKSKGYRFVTMYAQAIVPAKSGYIFYAFQGITNDGEYFISAIFPIKQVDLPDSDPADMQSFMANFDKYIAETTVKLDTAASESFTPTLNDLDAMLATLKVGKP